MKKTYVLKGKEIRKCGELKQELASIDYIWLEDSVAVAKDFKLMSVSFKSDTIEKMFVNFRVNCMMAMIDKKHGFMSPGIELDMGKSVDIQKYDGDDFTEWTNVALKQLKIGDYFCVAVSFSEDGAEDDEIILELVAA